MLCFGRTVTKRCHGLLYLLRWPSNSCISADTATKRCRVIVTVDAASGPKPESMCPEMNSKQRSAIDWSMPTPYREGRDFQTGNRYAPGAHVRKYAVVRSSKRNPRGGSSNIPARRSLTPLLQQSRRLLIGIPPLRFGHCTKASVWLA